MPNLNVQIKSIFAAPSETDGLRVYVERRKPRRRWEALKVDRHELALAPSADLHRLLAHGPEQWSRFRSRFEKQLAASAEAQAVLAELSKTARVRMVTVLYDGLDSAHNAARVVRAMIEGRHRSHHPLRMD